MIGILLFTTFQGKIKMFQNLLHLITIGDNDYNNMVSTIDHQTKI
jgi:hypothetical protein